MNIIPSAVLLAAATLAAAKPAERIGTSEVAMISSAAVRKELKVTPEQAKALDKVDLETHRRMAARFKQDDEEHADELRRRREAGLPAVMDHVMDRGEVDQAIPEVVRILTGAQLRRLAEVSLQHQGLPAFAKPKTAEELNLTPTTFELIKEVLDERAARQAELGAAYNKGPAGQSPAAALAYKKEVARIAAAQSALERTTEARIMKLLTKKQRARYRAMLGEPFDLEKAKEAARAATASK